MNEQMQCSDNIEITKIKKSALILRVGGLGDIVILTAIARELNRKGFDVDFFCGSPTGKVNELIDGLDYIREVKNISRINNIDCVQVSEKNWVSVEILKSKYSEVYDFKNSVEENRPAQFFNKDEGWRHTINSNFQNWIDLSLAWSNIDPKSITAELKQPDVKTKDEDKYMKWINELPIHDANIIGIQLQASSLIRSWYRAAELPEMIHKLYPNHIVLIFAGDSWIAITKNGKIKIEIPENLNPLVCSMFLVQQMKAFISADSGMSHIAEAVGTQNITIYTTVPSWTRDLYYKYSHAIQAACGCSPCFTLDAFCPLQRKIADEALTEREHDIVNSAKNNLPIEEVAKKYNTVPRAIMDEFQASQQKLQGLSAQMPACVASITPEMILDKLQELLNK